MRPIFLIEGDKMVKLYQDREWLYKKYINERLTTLKISLLCGVHPTTICNWLKKYNITIRSNSETSIGRIPWNKGLKAKDDIRIQNFIEAGNKARKGKPSWNKGKKLQTNTGRTHFKKGQMPHSKGLFGIDSLCWRGGRRESVKRCYVEKRKDIKFVLNNRISCSIRDNLKREKKGRHWGGLVGYSISDLIKRLKSTMPEGYTWQDFIEGKLHIDHKIPISAFNYTKPEHIDFKRCWALSNLQLLPKGENLRKSNKLTKPFQPALKLNFEVVI